MLTEYTFFLQSSNTTHMYATIIDFGSMKNPTNFEIVFSFLFTILVVYMISTFLLSFVEKEVETE